MIVTLFLESLVLSRIVISELVEKLTFSVKSPIICKFRVRFVVMFYNKKHRNYFAITHFKLN